MTASYGLAFPSDRLFAHAVRILDGAGERCGRPFDWTLGGGTVLALRHDHRFSKDVEIFVPNPQNLGYLSPRLSDAAAPGSPDFEEAAEFLKIRYPEGEVDFVASGSLTEPGSEPATVDRRPVRLETDLEIVAKKLYFRGNQFKARDLFDLALLLQVNPANREPLQVWANRHRSALLLQLAQSGAGLRSAFEAIDARRFRPIFSDALGQVQPFLEWLE